MIALPPTTGFWSMIRKKPVTGLDPVMATGFPKRSCSTKILSNTLGRLGDDFIGGAEFRLGVRHLVADACNDFKQGRLLVVRQDDQFAAARQPGLAGAVVDRDRLRIDSNRLGKRILVENLLQVCGQ